jgi:hypothetical protein
MVLILYVMQIRSILLFSFEDPNDSLMEDGTLMVLQD